MGVSEPPARAARAKLKVTGNVIQPLSWVRKTVGRRPSKKSSPSQRQAWLQKAARRLNQAYKSLGFSWCRVFVQAESEGPLRMDVDEGLMSSVELVGSTDIVKHILFPLDMSLPSGVFQKRLVREALGRLRVLHSLGPLSYRVLPGDWRINALGQRVRQRLLQVTVNRAGRGDGAGGDDGDGAAVGGFGFKLVADLRWGATAVGTVGCRNLLLKGDRLSGRLEVGIPVGRLLFEEDPKLRWVYGRFRLRYDFPEIGESNLHPVIDFDTSLPFEGRRALGLDRTLTLRTGVALGIVWRPLDDFFISLVGRLNYLKHMRVDRSPDWQGPTAETTDGLLRGEFATTFGFVEAQYRRRDLRQRLYITPKLLTNGDRTTFIGHMIGQLTLEYGALRARHYLIFRAQAWTLHGDIGFWDERPLSGTVHRVYTFPFVWARHAAQLEIAWRFPVVGEEFQLGLFHDGSVFEDRTANPVGPGRLAVGNAFGPSAHALLFNFLAIDVFYGFGLSSYGKFSHSLTFTLSNVF